MSEVSRFVASLLSAVWLAAASQAPATTPGPEHFSDRVVTSGLAGPWEMLWGPDGRLWVTERTGKRIVRIDPADGSRRVAVTIPDVLQTHSQDGLLGMALHSDFLKNRGTDYVYVVMTYDADPGPTETRRMMIRRYVYDARTETLGSPTDLVTGLPAGSDHVSGRLAFGPDQKLYLTVGDGGLNQLSLYCQPIHAQDLPTASDIRSANYDAYVGKVLRINLDGSIPADNPTFAGVRSHIYTVGHRNGQGLVFGPDGKLYEAEHGPSVDDELNLIVKGKNYGWPYVAGYQDDRVYVYANWSKSSPEPCASLTYDAIVAPPSVPQQKESAWHDPDFMPPIRTFFTVEANFRFSEGNATIAPSGIDIYTVRDGGIPGWADSVLVTSLTRGILYRVTLNTQGDAATGVPFEYFKMNDRFRDVTISPDGRTIYVATDPNSTQHPGAILAFTYQP